MNFIQPFKDDPGRFAAVTIASERNRPRLPEPQIYTNGLELYDGQVSIEPGVSYQYHEGFSPTHFDPKTHPGIDFMYRRYDDSLPVGREITLGRHEESGLWAIHIKDLEVFEVQGVPSALHFPHRDFSSSFLGEAHVVEGSETVDIVLVPYAPYEEESPDYR